MSSSIRGSRASRQSVYAEDAANTDGSSATELRDSNHTYGATTPPVETTSPTTGNDGTNNNNQTVAEDKEKLVTSTDASSNTGAAAVAAAAENGHGPLTWTDRDGTVYRYFVDPLFQVCPFILMQELCERLAFYGLNPTLKPFLKKTVNVGDAGASSLIGLFQGFLYLTPIFSAALADSFLGVYKTILYFSIVYGIGLGLMDIAAIEEISQPWMVYVALFVFICIGAGGIKSCVNVFGGQQFHPTAQKEQITTFFSYFYASINVGSIIGGIACPQVQHDVSFFAAYMIPFSSFVVATCIFIGGSGRYLKFKPQGSPVVDVAKVLFSAAKIRSIENTKKSKGGDFEDAFVDDTLQLLRLQPICALSVPMLVAYNQMTTAFLTQGEKMSNLIFGHDFSPAMMQNVDAFSVIITSVVVEKLLYPFLRHKNIMPTVVGRFAIGNAIAIFAVISAYIVELQVMTQVHPHTISIWAQIPQFALIAVSEIFVISTSYEVAFTMAPTRLKAVASACNLLWFSLAGFMSSLLFVICSSWMPDFKPHDYTTFQQSHYDYFFIVLASMCALGVVFCLLLREYFFRVAGGREETEEQKHTIVVSDAKLGAEEAALLDNC